MTVKSQPYTLKPSFSTTVALHTRMPRKIGQFHLTVLKIILILHVLFMQQRIQERGRKKSDCDPDNVMESTNVQMTVFNALILKKSLSWVVMKVIKTITLEKLVFI